MNWKKRFLIVGLSILLTGVVNTAINGIPFGFLYKAPWLLLATFVLEKKGGMGHIFWLFGIPFILGYFQYSGALGEAGMPYELAQIQYLIQPKMIILHLYHLSLYFGIYAVIKKFRNKRQQEVQEEAYRASKESKQKPD